MIKWALFETRLGELLLAFMERKMGLAVVDAECLGLQLCGEPKTVVEVQRKKRAEDCTSAHRRAGLPAPDQNSPAQLQFYHEKANHTDRWPDDKTSGRESSNCDRKGLAYAQVSVSDGDMHHLV